MEYIAIFISVAAFVVSYLGLREAGDAKHESDLNANELNALSDRVVSLEHTNVISLPKRKR